LHVSCLLLMQGLPVFRSTPQNPSKLPFVVLGVGGALCGAGLNCHPEYGSEGSRAPSLLLSPPGGSTPELLPRTVNAPMFGMDWVCPIVSLLFVWCCLCLARALPSIDHSVSMSRETGSCISIGVAARSCRHICATASFNWGLGWLLAFFGVGCNQ